MSQSNDGTRAADKYEPEIRTVVLSGGAPNSPLMAGFLYALLEQGKMFSNFHTAGAGALMALLCLAPNEDNLPKGDEPDDEKTQALKRGGMSDKALKVRAAGMKALKGWIDAGVADDIYRFFPINFKLFHKPGPFSPIFSRLAERYKVDIADGPGESTNDDPLKHLRNDLVSRIFDTPERRRTYNDLVDLCFSVMAPSTLTRSSKGLAAPVPFLESMVDFRKLREEVPAHLCINAFNMATREMDIFHNDIIDGRHIRAAFSMPFIYPPAQIGTDYYSEGADHEPINFQPLYDEREVSWKREFEDSERINRSDLIASLDRLTKELRDKELEVVTADERLRTMRMERITRTTDSLADETRINQALESTRKQRDLLELKLSELADQLGEINDEIATLRREKSKIRRVVLLDVMGSLDEHLVRPPRGLWDAYVISIMTPIVALAKKQIQRFEAEQALFKERNGYQYFELMKISFDIPSYAQPYVMDWSRSNLETLFSVGHKTGLEFYKSLGGDSPENPLPAIKEYRNSASSHTSHRH